MALLGARKESHTAVASPQRSYSHLSMSIQLGWKEISLGLSSTRIMIVDDFEPFRYFSRSTLRKVPDLDIVAEAANGLEAIKKTKELEPDLVLLDIGLPGLSGIEVARRIRQFSPTTKMLVVSQESSADVVEEAFRAGASGYIVKTDARKELIDALYAVLRGTQFIGRRFAGHDFVGTVE